MKRTDSALRILFLAFLMLLYNIYRTTHYCWKDPVLESNDMGYYHSSSSTQQQSNVHDICSAEYNRVTRHQTPGLTQESLQRSRATVGNKQRLARIADILLHDNRPSKSNKPTDPRPRNYYLNVVAFGGSITLAHGVVRNVSQGSGPYTDLLEVWLNDMYNNDARDKMAQNNAKSNHKHRVFNMAGHGADICSLAKRLHFMMQYLNRTHGLVQDPDLFLLEFAVNDYQGQDHVQATVSQHDVFFPHFQDLALCAEVVVHTLLHTYPQAAILFVEFQTGIPHRKTAQMIHVGVAQHYQVPVLSYGDALLPEYFRLVSLLNASDRYTVPLKRRSSNTSMSDGNQTQLLTTILPFPYGCHDCQPQYIDEAFRHSFQPRGIKHCRTVCDLVQYADQSCAHLEPPPAGREYCYPALFAVDAVHPSALGHAMATDLIVHAIASAVKSRCRGEAAVPHVMPNVGWLATPDALQVRSKFVLVQDTDCPNPSCARLTPIRKTPSFRLYSDATSFSKPGWIATNPQGGEEIDFAIDLPIRPCYSVYLAILRSYQDMGTMQVTVVDLKTNASVITELDGHWESKISVWSDNQVTYDKARPAACTGKCLVQVRTNPILPGRAGNKVKILTLSVRECVQV